MLQGAGQRLWESVYDVIFCAAGWLFYVIAISYVMVSNALLKAFNR